MIQDNIVHCKFTQVRANFDQVKEMCIKVQSFFDFMQINFIICRENSRFKQRTVIIALILVTRSPVSELAQNSNLDGVCYDVTEANG